MLAAARPSGPRGARTRRPWRAVVRAVYQEFGFAWEPDGYHADLADAEAGFDAFWVAELDGASSAAPGSRATSSDLPGTDCSLERMYVCARRAGTDRLCAAPDRGRGCAPRARAACMEIWSDKLPRTRTG